MKKMLSVVMIILFFTACAGCATMDKGKRDFIRNISFSPDGKKLLFDRRSADESYRIHVYDLATGELSAYKLPIGETRSFARYSFDGESIVFIAIPLIGHKEDLANSQIAIMDTDGKNVKKITNTTGLKLAPSFSHSGRKIIFARADVIREKGSRTPAAGYDVYEVEVATGRETRLTQFKFFEMSRPYYFPDDKTFVFWGVYPSSYPAVPLSDRNDAVMKKINKELKSKYYHHSIYVMRANEKELKPYLVMPEYKKKYKGSGSEYSRDPALSDDGSVLIFMSIGYKPDGSAEGWQFYQYSADGNHRQITHLNEIQNAAVSPRGELLAVIHEPTQAINKIVIYQVKDGTSRDITLPAQPSRIINSQ